MPCHASQKKHPRLQNLTLPISHFTLNIKYAPTHQKCLAARLLGAAVLQVRNAFDSCSFLRGKTRLRTSPCLSHRHRRESIAQHSGCMRAVI
jgi:hypothetical protein